MEIVFESPEELKAKLEADLREYFTSRFKNCIPGEIHFLDRHVRVRYKVEDEVWVTRFYLLHDVELEELLAVYTSDRATVYVGGKPLSDFALARVTVLRVIDVWEDGYKECVYDVVINVDRLVSDILQDLEQP